MNDQRVIFSYFKYELPYGLIKRLTLNISNCPPHFRYDHIILSALLIPLHPGVFIGMFWNESVVVIIWVRPFR